MEGEALRALSRLPIPNYSDFRVGEEPFRGLWKAT